MGRIPAFAAYHVGTYQDGSHIPAKPGDLTIYDDGKTYIYRDLDPRWNGYFFDWATTLFCDKDTPHRLAGSVEHGWRVEAGFVPPGPIPADDSEEYQLWLDGPYMDARLEWEAECRPAPRGISGAGDE